MLLHIHIDAYFLSEPEAKGRPGGYYYLIKKQAKPNKPPIKQPLLNGSFIVKYTTITRVLASAMEAELGALLVN